MEKQTAGKEKLGNFAPQFAMLNDDILFGTVWSRQDKLPLKERSLITIAALMGKGILDDSLKYHIANAKHNGVTKEEFIEVVTQLAFYTGWPNAWAVFSMAKEIYQKENDEKEHGGIFGIGKPNDAFEKYFVGNSYLKVLTNPEYGLVIANVTFEPGCRNYWHIHKADKGGGQILLCVEGEGWYQEEGKEAQSLMPGDVITIPTNVKHWHGAKKDFWFSHLAIEIPGVNTCNQWCEAVKDEEYNRLMN